MGQWGKGNACGRLRARGRRWRCSKIRAHFRKKKKKSVFPWEFLLHIPTPHQILIIFHFGILQKKIFLVVFFPGCLQRPKNGIIPKLL